MTRLKKRFAAAACPTSLHLLVRGVLLLVLLLSVSGVRSAPAGSLIYKNYIVRYDRGWDILCEPYVVQKNDWILKIFRQKGEIAHSDFREFLGVFQRLNPHVTDINMVRPGQAVDIPLRKLEHGTLPGQSSGVVTIPFVTLTKVIEAIHQSSSQYVIQKGDTVSELVAKYYGRYGTRPYQEGVKLFQAANPQITNIDKIYAGQKIYLPDPSIREKEWYDAMYDEQGNLRQTLKQGAGPGSDDARTARPPLPSPEPSKPQSPLEEAAATVAGDLSTKGTYFIPQPNGNDFEIDLSQHPMLTLPESKMLFTQNGRIMGVDPEALQQSWPEGKVIDYDEAASVEEIVAAIFGALEEKEDAQTEVSFWNQGVQVAVRAKWIKALSDQRWLCITPIASLEERTPEPMRRYLEQNGIQIKEVLPGNQTSSASPNEPEQRHMVKNILAITPNGQKDFAQRLCKALNFSYAPNVAVSFPYAGIQIQAFANLLSTPSGGEILVDFGDLYGDAIESISKSGMRVVQITANDTYTAMVRKILTALGERYVDNPTFLAARRAPDYNASVTVQGVLYADSKNNRTMLSAADLHSAVTDLLSAEGVAVVTW